jgi:molybdopterin/thiamine biosynthesis adenylyltransferase
VVRAGAAGVVLRDKSIVAPGVLSRQLFDEADLGNNKATALGAALARINPDVDVTVRTGDVLASDSDLDVDWTDGCDVVIDATADNRVPKLTELRRRSHAMDVPMVTVFIGHTAEHGLMTFTPASGISGPAGGCS